MRISVVFQSVCLVCLLADSPLLLAAEPSGWFVRLGVFNPKVSTNIRLDALNGQLGTNLHLESDLDLPERRTVPQGALGYRFTPRSSLEFGYFDLRRNGSRAIDEDISYGGETYIINTVVSTFSDIRTEFIQYRYVFLDRDAWALSAIAGLHVTYFTLGLSDSSMGVSKSAEARAPSPLVGVQASYDLWNWRLQATAEYFKMTVNGLHGYLSNYAVSVSHRLPADLSVELGYQRDVLSVTAERRSFTGTARLAYQGPFLALCYRCMQ
ncbi:MAG: hypothetical protein ACRETA_00765 [Gammaproteobacteria bacterium]